MIPIEKLQAVRTIVTHDNCPDGMASAMILHDALPAAEIVFARYGSPELAALPATEGMLFVDFSPPAERAAEFVAAGAICLDHHKTARGVVESFRSLGVFGDEETELGVCGAVLAFREVWWPLLPKFGDHYEVNSFATLAGVRDTWQRNDPRWREACAQAEALRFWPRAYLLDLEPSAWADALEIGPVLLDKKAEADAERIAGAERFSLWGTRVVIFNSLETSDVMEALKDEADLVLGFAYRCDGERRRLVVSCRSRALDVGAFAKSLGGGGHTRAAGFTIDVEHGAPNPYEHVRLLVERWLRSMP